MCHISVESPAVYVKMLTSTLFAWLVIPSHYNYILHDSLNTMLGKTSVSMMVLLVAASLIGISSIHQYIEGQIATEPLTEPPATTPTPKPQQAQKQSAAGSVRFVSIYETSQGKFCVASVLLPSK